MFFFFIIFGKDSIIYLIRYFMKNWKLILVLLVGASSLFLGACSKDDDNSDPELVEDKVSLPKDYGVTAIFPVDSWGCSYFYDFKYDDSRAIYSRDCIATYLREDSVYSQSSGKNSYYTIIYFCRLDKTFSSEAEAKDFVSDLQYVLDGSYDKTGENLPNMNYKFVSEVKSVQLNDYNASLIEVIDKQGYYQANHFVYDGGRLYWVTLSLKSEHYDSKDAKYQECISILNTFKLVD